jgi:hypothetical protein
MLIVVEGPSAVGKTTLLGMMPVDQVVPEEIVQLPTGLGPLEAQPYFVESNSRRWARLLQVEAQYGQAYADTDPLKLYYDFSLVAIGELTRDVFETNWRLVRHAVATRRYGFADRIVFLLASPETLAARKAGDTTRRRSGFAVHVRLWKAMDAYYRALARLRPGTIHWLDTESVVRNDVIVMLENLILCEYNRYDTTLLDALKRDLDQLLDAEHQWI